MLKASRVVGGRIAWTTSGQPVLGTGQWVLLVVSEKGEAEDREGPGRGLLSGGCCGDTRKQRRGGHLSGSREGSETQVPGGPV